MEVRKLGNIYGYTGGCYSGNVYDKYGLAPTINTYSGGHRQPMIIVDDNSPAILTPKRTEYGKEIRKTYEKGEIKEKRHNMTQLEPRKDGLTNTLTTVQKDNLLLGNTVKVRQATKEPIEFELGGIINVSYPDSKTRRGRVIEKGNISPTITAAGEGGGNVQLTEQYRIRKLTPKECGRLMGVSDEDIDKMAAVNSNTQLYKQFGNSIVVDVMYYMFKNLHINIPKQGEIVYDCI